MSPQGCSYCPKVDEVHQGKEATIFLMAVVNVPGKTPVVVTTPKFATTMPDNPTPCDVCNTVATLYTKSVLHGAVDLAEEIRQNFTPKTPVVSLEVAGGGACPAKCSPDGGCGGQLPGGPDGDAQVRPGS